MNLIKNTNYRIKCLKKLVYILFSILLVFIIKTIVFEHDYYKNKLNALTNIYIYDNSVPRGRIYDRNNNVLVDNAISYEIVYKDDNISDLDKVKLAYKVIDKINLDYTKLNERNLKEFYLVTHEKELKNRITKEEYNKLKNKILNSKDIYNLKISRITDDDLNELNDNDKKASYIYYLMNNGYSYQDKIIKSDATYSEYAFFLENSDTYKGFKANISWKRIYPYNDTFKSILGSIGNIPKENKDYYLKEGYNLNDKVGLSNIEKEYDDILRGEKNIYKKVGNNKLKLIKKGRKGNDIVLSIDINLEKDIENIIDNNLIRAKSEPNTKYLNKSYVIIQEPNTGEILAMSGRGIIKNDKEYKTYDLTPYILTDAMTPGSVVKGASMIVGYNTNSLKIGETLTDECIKFYSKPKKCSYQRYGRLNDIDALAYSSNVYQFKIAMRVANIDYKYNTKANVSKDAFDIYRNTFNSFGLGVKTEIDLPNESIGYIGNTISPDLLLNYAIGQYDTYTPIQLSQYITTIASNGNRLKPHLLKKIIYNNKIKEIKPVILNKIDTKEDYLERIKKGFVSVMDYGYGKNVMGNAPNPAGKTGTSETFLDTNLDGKIDKETTSNAFVGYAPSDNPKMTITVTSPDVEDPNTNIDYRTYMNRRIVKDISNLYFKEYAD